MAEKISAQRLRALERQMSQLMRDAARRGDAPPRGVEDPEWMQRTQEFLDAASPDHLTHPYLRAVERRDLKIRRGLSFKAFMVQESETRRLGLPSASWLLDQKLVAYRFIDELRVRRPAAELRARAFDQLTLEPPMVVKPRRGAGSRGCYLILAEDDIVHVEDGMQFRSLTELREHAQGLMRGSEDGRTVRDRWMVEELILEDRTAARPAGDLKYFCFYGEVLFVLEVRRDEGVSRYSFRQPDRTPFVPGPWKYEFFEGQGSTDAQLELARQISLQIPHPFCRIDMLRGEDELVFGEFTPRPGGFHNFSEEWDRRMGEAWAAAQHRLQLDLLSGKAFEPFARATRLLEQDHAALAAAASRWEPSASGATADRNGAGASSRPRRFAARAARAVSHRLPFRRR